MWHDVELLLPLNFEIYEKYKNCFHQNCKLNFPVGLHDTCNKYVLYMLGPFDIDILADKMSYLPIKFDDSTLKHGKSYTVHPTVKTKRPCKTHYIYLKNYW